MSLLWKRASAPTPEALRDHAERWASEHAPHYSDPRRARGWCEDASVAYSRAGGGDVMCHGGRGGDFHYYNRVSTTDGDYAVDHTARQFDHTVGAPVVRPFHEHERWVSEAMPDANPRAEHDEHSQRYTQPHLGCLC